MHTERVTKYTYIYINFVICRCYSNTLEDEECEMKDITWLPDEKVKGVFVVDYSTKL